jgi:hypothetical protein
MPNADGGGVSHVGRVGRLSSNRGFILMWGRWGRELGGSGLGFSHVWALRDGGPRGLGGMIAVRGELWSTGVPRSESGDSRSWPSWPPWPPWYVRLVNAVGFLLMRDCRGEGLRWVGLGFSLVWALRDGGCRV